MAAPSLLSSPLGPAMRFDVFDQPPSSPLQNHDDLPPEFDRSFGSSMSLGSSCDLPRASSNQQLGQPPSSLSSSSRGPAGARSSPLSQHASSSKSYDAVNAASEGRTLSSSPTSASPTFFKRQTSPLSSRQTSPTHHRGLGAAMGTTLESKSPRLAAMMSSPHYMDISPAPQRVTASLSGSSLASSDSADSLRKKAFSPNYSSNSDERLPPGSAMKEDTPQAVRVRLHQQRRSSSRPNSRPSSRNSRRESAETASGGAKLGRLFGTNMSLNASAASPSMPSASSTKKMSGLTESDLSFEKSPPAKRRPSSLQLAEGRANVRPPLKSASFLNSSRRSSGLTKHPKEDSRRSSSDNLVKQNRASDPLSTSLTASKVSRSRQSSSDLGNSLGPNNSSFAQSIRERSALTGLGSIIPAHSPIIESPSPTGLARHDFGSYFFDPQSPEAARLHDAVGGVSPSASPSNSLTARLMPSADFGEAAPSTRPGRPFQKAVTSAIVPTLSTSQSQSAQSQTLLGKRANPYSRRPPLVPAAVQHIKADARPNGLKSANAVLNVSAAESASSSMLRPTAPAPRRCHSAFDHSALLASVEPSSSKVMMMLPNSTSSGSIEMEDEDLPTALPSFPDEFDGNGSPVAQSSRPKTSRPGFFRKTSKDDSSPLGYGSRRQADRQEAGLSVQDPEASASIGSAGSPMSAECMPGFGASERAGKVLPCFNVKEDGLMRITPGTLVSLMQGQYNDQIESYQVIDCRFGYEHQGGHIPGSMNLSTIERVKTHFLSGRSGCRGLPPRSQSGKADGFGSVRKPVLIFHCEFSCKRAPSIALALRQADRGMAHDYPNCHYPELYILQGGYCGFYKAFSGLCEPQAYVEMDDPKYQDQRSAELNGFRKMFARHRSFTYGDGAQNGNAPALLRDRPGPGPSKLGPSDVKSTGPGSNLVVQRPQLRRQSQSYCPPDGDCSPTVRINDGFSEAESSFETDSPSNFAAAKRDSQMQRHHSTGLISTLPTTNRAAEEQLGEAFGDETETDTSFEASFEYERPGSGRSSCVAAGARKGSASLGVGKSSGSTLLVPGAQPPRESEVVTSGARRLFQRAGTTGQLLFSGSNKSGLGRM